MQDAGRWALLRRPSLANLATPAEPGAQVQTQAQTQPLSQEEPHRSDARARRLPSEAIEHAAMTLLRRYGVVFWQLLEREPDWLPRWRELLHALHRMEARGLIRGGRFVNGLSGEQFALPEALPLLREVRKRDHDGQFVCVCAADPLNIVGTVLPGEKVPAFVGNRIALRDGACVATLIAGKFEFAAHLTPAEKEAARLCLAHRK
jgi:ATP-dependent Lhr-like helicase